MFVRRSTFRGEGRAEWTIVRVPWLTEGEGTGEYRAGDISLGIERLARSDLALFLLDCVEDEQFVRELRV